MSTRTNLVVDVVIAAAFLVAANPPVSGQAAHEWFGLAFGGAVIAHVVLHWDWIISATKKLLLHRGRGLRLNYAVDAFLFVALTSTVLSGVLASRHVLASFGLPPNLAPGWRGLHSLAANASVAAMGVHLGLHWDWIALNAARFVGMNGKRTARAGQAQPSTGGAAFAGDIGK
jgi:hypothetical protein